ncbi:MAG TPA: hypothetical protein VH439_03090 [Gemmatimonadales bacterium]|jgi:hypothetical protein
MHILAVVLFFTVQWAAPWRKQPSYVVLEPPETGTTMVYMPGSRAHRAQEPTKRGTRHEAPPPSAQTPPPVPPPAPPAAAAAALPLDTAPPPTMPAYDPNASKSVAAAPQVGDGRLWVSPRPALPASVAAAIYGDTASEHAAAINRLKAMVDSLNQILDQEQRERHRPSWTVGGTPDKPAWGIDSAYIHVAGVKIPTPVLALLGNLLPQGNFDEDMRVRQLNDMRADIMYSAERAQSLAQFKRYVRELRERKQAERDAEDRRRAQDTVKAVP